MKAFSAIVLVLGLASFSQAEEVEVFTCDTKRRDIEWGESGVEETTTFVTFHRVGKPVWYLFGRTGEGDVRAFERYWTAEEAQAALGRKAADDDGLNYSVDVSESIIPDRTLPTERQRVEIGGFLHRAFVVLRYVSYGRENFEAIEQLTDILHNFPKEMFEPDRWDWNSYIYALRGYEEKFPDVQTMNLAAMLEAIRDNAREGGVPNT